MKISALVPACTTKVEFAERLIILVPTKPGCYALSNVNEEILYIGQGDLGTRMKSHLRDPEKTTVTRLGKAFFFHYRITPEIALNKIERGWVQQHEDMEGEMPILNKIKPPMP